MTRLEEDAVGYPGFLVKRPPLISLASAALKRVALAKLSDVILMSATFGGEDLVFQPWLTLLVDHGRRALLIGVYRTDYSSDVPELPIWCLRKSEWVRETDLEQSERAADLNEYLTSGPQVTDRLVFVNRVTHPEIDVAMDTVLTALGSGITVSPVERRAADWQYVELDLTDDRLICKIEYSPLTARSESVEAALPPWLDRIDDSLQREGFPPDGEITLSVRRSVPEMTRMPERRI